MILRKSRMLKLIGGSFVILAVDLLFLNQNFGLMWGPMKAFCHSVNVPGVVVLLAGGGDDTSLGLAYLYCNVPYSIDIPMSIA